MFQRGKKIYKLRKCACSSKYQPGHCLVLTFSIFPILGKRNWATCSEAQRISEFQLRTTWAAKRCLLIRALNWRQPVDNLLKRNTTHSPSFAQNMKVLMKKKKEKGLTLLKAHLLIISFSCWTCSTRNRLPPVPSAMEWDSCGTPAREAVWAGRKWQNQFRGWWQCRRTAAQCIPRQVQPPQRQQWPLEIVSPLPSVPRNPYM